MDLQVSADLGPWFNLYRCCKSKLFMLERECPTVKLQMVVEWLCEAAIAAAAAAAAA